MSKITRLNALLAAAAACTAPAFAAQRATTLDPVLNFPRWLDARPNPASLAGKVVLLDVFTFACENCQNITPNLRALHQAKSAELAIVGIHTPETPYERDRGHIAENLKRLGITWPVALDNDMRLWVAYGVEYWPTQLIFDRKGRLASTVVGDSQDEAVNKTIAALAKTA
jgi:thiol-disulfide isomerase/thioredoxin